MLTLHLSPVVGHMGLCNPFLHLCSMVFKVHVHSRPPKHAEATGTKIRCTWGTMGAGGRYRSTSFTTCREYVISFRTSPVMVASRSGRSRNCSSLTCSTSLKLRTPCKYSTVHGQGPSGLGHIRLQCHHPSQGRSRQGKDACLRSRYCQDITYHDP